MFVCGDQDQFAFSVDCLRCSANQIFAVQTPSSAWKLWYHRLSARDPPFVRQQLVISLCFRFSIQIFLSSSPPHQHSSTTTSSLRLVSPPSSSRCPSSTGTRDAIAIITVSAPRCRCLTCFGRRRLFQGRPFATRALSPEMTDVSLQDHHGCRCASVSAGPKLGLLLDPYFLFTYGKSLETEASRFTRPGDFFVYLVFVACMILLTGGLYLDGPVLLSPLTLALAYTFAQENPNRQMTYFIVTFSSKWLPYAMLAMTFVMGSPQEAFLQATGLVAAHAYDFVTKYWPEYGGGSRLLSTPQFVQNWFAQPQGTPSQRGFGTAFSGRPMQGQNSARQPAGGDRGSAWGSGFNSSPWSTRGQGRRLGGE
nr:derlin-1 [Quercus suber]